MVQRWIHIFTFVLTQPSSWLLGFTAFPQTEWSHSLANTVRPPTCGRTINTLLEKQRAPKTPTQQHCYSRLSLGRAQPTERVAVVTKQEKEFASSLRTSFLTSRSCVCVRKCEYTCMGEWERPPVCTEEKFLAVATVSQYTIISTTCNVGGRWGKLAF